MPLMRFLCLLCVSLFALASCTHFVPATANASLSHFDCHAYPYLATYHCSLSRILNEAQMGDADAEYALGYMYYYGIHTPKDPDSAKLWFARAASAGQPLAERTIKSAN